MPIHHCSTCTSTLHVHTFHNSVPYGHECTGIQRIIGIRAVLQSGARIRTGFAGSGGVLQASEVWDLSGACLVRDLDPRSGTERSGVERRGSRSRTRQAELRSHTGEGCKTPEEEAQPVRIRAERGTTARIHDPLDFADLECFPAWISISFVGSEWFCRNSF